MQWEESPEKSTRSSGVFLISHSVDFDNLSHRHRQPDALSQARGQQFIGQHAQMLRIILEFHHVEVAVIGAHQMRLRSSAHSSNMLDRFHRHGGILAFGTQHSALHAQQATNLQTREEAERNGGGERTNMIPFQLLRYLFLRVSKGFRSLGKSEPGLNMPCEHMPYLGFVLADFIDSHEVFHALNVAFGEVNHIAKLLDQVFGVLQ